MSDSPGPVLLDIQATQSLGSRDRGVARYCSELASALVAHHPEAVHGFVLNPDLPPPGHVEALVASGRTGYIDRYDARGAEIWHVGSPFELDAPLHRIWPARSVTAGMSLVVTLFDVIPLLFPDLYLMDPGLRRRYRTRLELVRAAELVLAISETTAADAMDTLGLAADRIEVLGTAPASGLGPPRSRRQALEAARLAVDGLAERFVLYTAGMDARKNFERLFRAWSLLPGEVRADRQLVVVCAMDELGRNHLRHLAAQAGMTGPPLLPGFVPDDLLGLLYQSTELSVCPSLYEGYGMPVAEALACGAVAVGSQTSEVGRLLHPTGRFDPTDEEDMSRVLRRALVDMEVRATLTDHATRFGDTWEKVSDRAAAAYDKVLSRRRSRSRQARRRPTVAVVTPLPPAASGVADYSYRLLEHLGRHCDVRVYVDGTRWTDGPPRAPEGIPVEPVHDFEHQELAAGGFDAVLYCLGNSQFHSGALAALRSRPGLVLAHEARMTDLYALAVDEPGAVPEGFASTLSEMYGPRLHPAAVGLGRLDGSLAEGLGLLMAREVASLSERLLVMSEFAAERVRLDARPEDVGKVTVVPFGYPAAGPDHAAWSRAPAEADALIGTFGVVNEVKQTALLIMALATVADRHPGTGLVVIGPCATGEAARLRSLAAATGVGERVTITGAVGPEEYRRWLARVDLAVQLRRTTNGECSAAVADCLAEGPPLVVTDTGSFRELPADTVARVPAAVTAVGLGRCLSDLLDDPARRRAMGEAGRRWASSHGFDRLAEVLMDRFIGPGTGGPLVLGSIRLK